MTEKETPIPVGPNDRVFVLTGAGVSAESGLKTFRDQGGLWEGHRVEDVATPEAWAADAGQVWRFYSERRKGGLQARPNPAHRALAELEAELGERLFLVTQNVDDLHERAGSKNVVHMHGELFQSRCEFSGLGAGLGSLGCERPPFRDASLYETEAAIPRCAAAGGSGPTLCGSGRFRWRWSGSSGRSIARR
jgi:NAD-dependent protein deacetylase/lipoamidase